MKKITSILLIALAALFIIPSMNSCKKGEEDPFFSFLSRKQRVSGDWNINALTSNITHLDLLSGHTRIVDLSIEGETITEKSETRDTPNDTIIIRKGTVLADNYIFEKDGTYNSTVKYNLVKNFVSDDGIISIDSTTTITTEEVIIGTWNFNSGVEKNWKNKERIVVTTVSKDITTTSVIKTVVIENGLYNDEASDTKTETNVEKYTFENGENTMIWAIQMLKSKEMKLTRDIDNEYIAKDETGTVENHKSQGTETLLLSQE